MQPICIFPADSRRKRPNRRRKLSPPPDAKQSKESSPTPKDSIPSSDVLMVQVENLVHEKFKNTEEVKVS